MDHTDPRYVTRADRPRAGSRPASSQRHRRSWSSILDATRSRAIISFHVKDGVNPTPVRRHGQPPRARRRRRRTSRRSSPRPRTRSATTSTSTTRSPRATTAASTRSRRPTRASPPCPATRPGRGHAARRSSPRCPPARAAANNVTPITVTNIGDAPLVFTNSAPTLAADADDGGNTTRDDFSIVSQDCSEQDARAGQGRRGRRSATPASRDRSRRPGRHLHHQRRLQADAHQLHLDRPPARSPRTRDDAIERRAARRHEHRRRDSAPSAATSRACSR